jgi:hypothetical protein
VDDALRTPWQAELGPVLARYSTNQEYQLGFDLITALQERGLLELHQQHRAVPVPFRQPLDAYVESFHARSGFSRDRMDPAASAEFDRAVRSIVAPYGDPVELQITATVAWGRPMSRNQESGVRRRRDNPRIGSPDPTGLPLTPDS